MGPTTDISVGHRMADHQNKRQSPVSGNTRSMSMYFSMPVKQLQGLHPGAQIMQRQKTVYE